MVTPVGQFSLDFTASLPASNATIPADQPVPSQAPHIWTVSALTTQLKLAIEGAYPDVWVVGEVSNFRPHSSGHWFFRLKDEQSIIEAVVFRGVNQKFSFAIENGMALICHGRLNLYPPQGKYSLLVDSAEPKGVGALQLAFEQLKKRLSAEGLFDARHKKPLPPFPRRVGIVTAATGAAVQDMLKVLQRRFPAVAIRLAPAKVQGEGAAATIVAALEHLDHHGACDVIIVGRGGGSVEDLWAFNEEVVARAIFACRTPVVSAVGHEIDFTIADFVADVRAPTPSAAAEVVVPDQQELLLQVAERRYQLNVSLRRWWEERRNVLNDLHQRLRPPTARFPDLLLQIAHGRERLVQAVGTRWREGEGRLRGLAGELQHLSPLAVLAKGYAVVTDTVRGKAVRRAADVAPGEQLHVRFAEGGLKVTVKERV
ncbi:MAG: exodeoxyribonuclease VII large subunit [Deltaproteobacteria bacterium]|nr:exodeoxyribonuclease VII large subunit [Deltaproteobacteria bacterium]